MRPIKLMDERYRTWAFLCGRCKRVHTAPDRLILNSRPPDAEDIACARESAERCCRCQNCKRPLSPDKDRLNQRCKLCEAKANKERSLFRRRMKVTRTAFLTEYNDRLQLAKSQDAAFRLVSAMRNLSESMWCAGWLIGLEFELWRDMLLGGIEGPKKPLYVQLRITPREARNLRCLARRAGGWWMWWQEPKGCAGVKESGEVFVPMKEWKKIYAEHCKTQKEQGDR